MRIKIQHTIKCIIEENIEDWNSHSSEECLERVKRYIEEDPDYVFDGLSKFTIESEIVK